MGALRATRLPTTSYRLQATGCLSYYLRRGPLISTLSATLAKSDKRKSFTFHTYVLAEGWGCYSLPATGCSAVRSDRIARDAAPGASRFRQPFHFGKRR